MLKRTILAGFATFAILTQFAFAQPSNPGVQRSGAVVTGNCAKWLAPNAIQDSGAPCGGGGGGGLTVGTTTIASGVTTRLLYDNAGILGEYALVPVANGGTNLASGTSGGILGYTASGVLASSAALGAGQVVVGGGAGATPASSATFASSGAGQVTAQGLTTTSPGFYTQITGDTFARVRVGLNVADVASIGFGGGAAVRDAFLERIGANTLGVVNSTNPQTLQVFGSRTDAANGDWLEFNKAAASAAYIRTAKNGAGVASTLSLGVGGANFWTIDTSGNLIAVNDGVTDIGAAAANRPRTLHLGTSIVLAGTNVMTSGGTVQTASAAGTYGWPGRSNIASPSDGVMTFFNAAQTGFTAVNYGGITASFPRLTRNGATLETKLADNSGFADHKAQHIVTNAADFMHVTSTALTDGAAAALGTLTNAPTAGNPTKWIPINDNGTTRYIPAW